MRNMKRHDFLRFCATNSNVSVHKDRTRKNYLKFQALPKNKEAQFSQPRRAFPGLRVFSNWQSSEDSSLSL